MNKLSAILALVVLSLGEPTSAQPSQEVFPRDTLAKVGSTMITGRDLLERIEFMPWRGKDRPSERDSSKIQALNSLMAEKLLAMEAIRRDIGNDRTSFVSFLPSLSKKHHTCFTSNI